MKNFGRAMLTLLGAISILAGGSVAFIAFTNTASDIQIIVGGVGVVIAQLGMVMMALADRR